MLFTEELEVVELLTFSKIQQQQQQQQQQHQKRQQSLLVPTPKPVGVG
jgi:hypothetical protein